MALAESEDFSFADVDDLGTYKKNKKYLKKHIKEVLNLDLVDVKAIKKAKFKVVVDGVNLAGSVVNVTRVVACDVDDVNDSL